MKRILVALIIIVMVQGVAYSEEDAGRGKNFEKIKTKILKNIDKRRGILDNFESCIKSANSQDDLKSCREENKKEMEALLAERKEMRKKMRKKIKKNRGKEKD